MAEEGDGCHQRNSDSDCPKFDPFNLSSMVQNVHISPRRSPQQIYPVSSQHCTDLSRWPLFSVLTADIILTIKKICVFGSSGNEAIYITESDDVYAFGSNCSSCLGLGEIFLEIIIIVQNIWLRNKK